MRKAYSYLRFSTPEQMKGDSYRRQTELMQEWLAKNPEVELDARLTFHDLGVSAFRGRNSETGKLAEFKAAVEAGFVEPGSFLLVESLDRLSRQTARLAQRVLEDLCELGIAVVTLSDEKVYTKETLDKDPLSLLLCVLIFIRANEESARKADRLQRAWVGKRQQAANKPLTAKGPGWLRLDRNTRKWVVIPERAAVVQRVFSETLEGRGQHAITESLNRERVPVFGKAGQWHRSYVVKILNNPAVMGTFIPRTGEWQDGKRVRKDLGTVPHYFPAVVDPETFQRVQAMRQDGRSPTRGVNAGMELQNVLGGLLVCSRCGGRMNMVNKGARSRRSVVCRRAKTGAGCTYESFLYATLEEALLSHAAPLLLEPRAGGPNGSEIQAEYESAGAGLEALDDYIARLWYTHKTNRRPGILEQIEEAGRHREELRERIRELAVRRDAVLGPFVERRAHEALDVLTKKPLDRKRANVLLRSLFASVTVNPETGTMDFLWKGGGCSDVVFAWPRETAQAA